MGFFVPSAVLSSQHYHDPFFAMGLLAKLLPVAIQRWLLSSLGETSDDRFARVFHASPDWIVITRLSDGLVIDANEGFEAISGYRAADVIGHAISRFNVWGHAEQRARLIDELMRSSAVRETMVQLRRRDGTLRDCMVNASLIALGSQTHSHAVWIAPRSTQPYTQTRLRTHIVKESRRRAIL